MAASLYLYEGKLSFLDGLADSCVDVVDGTYAVDLGILTLCNVEILQRKGL